MTVQIANNAKTVLTANVSAPSTQITVQDGGSPATAGGGGAVYVSWG